MDTIGSPSNSAMIQMYRPSVSRRRYGCIIGSISFGLFGTA